MLKLRHWLVWVVLAVTSGASAAAPIREPANIDLLKAEIRAYVSSGQYQRDIAGVAAEADAWLVERVGKKVAGERLTVVFDLDETLLSNWPFIEEQDVGGSDGLWETWMAKGQAPAIEPVRSVYLTARKLGLDVVFLTGRREHLRSATEQNLRAIGCGDYAVLLMKPDKLKSTAAAYKTTERARLESQGRKIVANLGDQVSDLSGGFAEKTFKLPDPFYLTD
jgi:acid phosphatase